MFCEELMHNVSVSKFSVPVLDQNLEEDEVPVQEHNTVDPLRLEPAIPQFKF